MKITVNYKNLIKIVSIIERIISKNPSLPILNNILLKTENGRLKLAATNLEIGINGLLGAKIEENGEIAVPARIFSDFINNIREEKITLTAKNNILTINTEKYKTQILGFDTKDFPIIPKIRKEIFLNIPSKILKSGLNSVFDSIAVSETRPELAGVFVQFNEKQLTFSSTDSFRLTERIIELKSKNNNSFILPRSTVLELIRLLGDVNEEVVIKHDDNQISFSTEAIEVVSRLINGSYPDYKKVIPEKYISRLLVKKEDLDNNVRLAGIFSSNISDIKISCDNKILIITAKNSDKGEIKINTEALLKNEPFDMSLNHHYLLDGLKIMPTEHVIIEYTGQGSPLVLRPEHELKDLTYLIMPLRK